MNKKLAGEISAGLNSQTRRPDKPDITLSPAEVVALGERIREGVCQDCGSGGILNPAPHRCVKARSNQEALGNGCVCETGCDSCDALAETYAALLEATQYAMDYAGITHAQQTIWDKARAAIALAHKRNA